MRNDGAFVELHLGDVINGSIDHYSDQKGVQPTDVVAHHEAGSLLRYVLDTLATNSKIGPGENPAYHL